MDPSSDTTRPGHATRRTFLRAGLAVAVGLVAARIGGRSPRSALARENCYWQTVSGPTCQAGRWKVYRCYICCQPCETVFCQWQDLGAC